MVKNKNKNSKFTNLLERFTKYQKSNLKKYIY